MTPQEQAVSLFHAGNNCSQAVLCTFADRLGLDVEIARRLAAPLGGGLSRSAATCGAVTGALMALGLAMPEGTPKQDAYDVGRDFLHRFAEQCGHTECKALLGVDISTPQGHDEARASGLFRERCPELVGVAAEIVEEMLSEHKRG